MAQLNNFVLQGRCGADATMRYLPSGRAITNVSIAHSKWRKDGEEFVETTHWFPISAYGPVAERLARAEKGDLLVITGTLSSRQTENDDGQKRTYYGFDVEDFQLFKKGGNDTQGARGADRLNDSGNDESEDAPPWDDN